MGGRGNPSARLALERGNQVTAPVDLDQFVRDEWIRRVRAHHYVFPIHATATMRMMTPVKAVHFARQHCAPLCTRGQPCP